MISILVHTGPSSFIIHILEMNYDAMKNMTQCHMSKILGPTAFFSDLQHFVKKLVLNALVME